ncbi:MAG TPA: diguanylate cyclase [Candidatus Limnocylindria bacterium]|jgi:diguanylate cyclase (GGDEF)-like protein|nr:diguanylate cyclase [Candidatus Limnocylindria bacterium]
MLRLARALGFLAPIAVTAFVLVVISTSPTASGPARSIQLLIAALALVAGMTSMALAAWSYVGWRLNRIARALEDTLDADVPVLLRVGGIPAERRLARAFNAAAGAFLQVEARATHDRLTGIANRETLLTTLVAEVERATRHHSWLSVAFIDIDRFKPINDTYGHKSGDAILRQVANVIADNIRGSDLLGRYGGEEFMLILPETQPDEAVVLAEKLRSLVAAHSLLIAGQQRLQVTISVGVAGEIGSQLQVDALVDQADAAMYAAKQLGRDRTYLYRAVDENAPVRRAPISSEHRHAATAIGRWANDTATEALASVLAPQPHHRGRPSDMIASLATGIALEMGLPREEIERIRVASLLHDLGKLAVPSEILDKPTALSDGEWQAIGEHPRIGQVILEQASSLREAIPVVLHHHERFNGGGYPHGLRGNEIPIGARIVSVADAYHAMVHDRPYKTALGHEAALAELRANAGTQFDPEVVNLFCAVYADGVPPDGLEEVYRLHERARGGLQRLDPHAAAAVLTGRQPADPEPKAKPSRSTRSRPRGRTTTAEDEPAPRRVREAAG